LYLKLEIRKVNNKKIAEENGIYVEAGFLFTNYILNQRK